jgi:hypothetical protein
MTTNISKYADDHLIVLAQICGLEAFRKQGGSARAYEEIFVQSAYEYCEIQESYKARVNPTVILALMTFPVYQTENWQQVCDAFGPEPDLFMKKIETIDFSKPLYPNMNNLSDDERGVLGIIVHTQLVSYDDKDSLPFALSPLHQKLMDWYEVPGPIEELDDFYERLDALKSNVRKEIAADIIRKISPRFM